MNREVVITGANRGIGLSLTKHYLAEGDQVTAVCRRSSDALEHSKVDIIDAIDMAGDAGVKRLAEQIGNKSIDLLINNAGMLQDEVLGQIDYSSIRSQFEVNALGPLRVTEALHENLASNAKVAMITSRMGSVADNTSGGRYGYRMSKAALNIAAVSLAHDLKDKGVAIAIIHPGLVGTEMIGGHGDLTPDQAADRIAQRIEDLTLATSGTFWHSNGEVLPW